MDCSQTEPQGNCGAPRDQKKTKRRITAESWSPIGKELQRGGTLGREAQHGAQEGGKKS